LRPRSCAVDTARRESSLVPQAVVPTLTLEIISPDHPPERRVVTAERTIIGRESGDVVLHDPESSALHAEIDCSHGHVIVRDLGSRNGTLRDGKRLPQFALYPGQSFRVGATEIRLLSVEGGPSHPAPGRTAVLRRPDASRGRAVGKANGTHVGDPSEEPEELMRGSGSKTVVGGIVPPPAEPPMRPTDRDPRQGSQPSAPPAIVSVEARVDRRQDQEEEIDNGITNQFGPNGTPSSKRTLVGSAADDTGPAPSVVQASAPQVEVRSGNTTVGGPPIGPILTAPRGALASGERPRVGPPMPPALPGRRSGSGAFYGLFIVIALLAASAVVAYYVIRPGSAGSGGFAHAVAVELPDDAVGVISMASFEQFLVVLGEGTPDVDKQHAAQKLRFDPFSSDRWSSMGIDVSAPLGLSLLELDGGVMAVSVGVQDQTAFTAALQTDLAPWLGVQSLPWTPKTFGNIEGFWLGSPLPAAALMRNGRATLVWGGGADKVLRQADLIASATTGQTLADRAGFKGLGAVPSSAIAMLYIDGKSAEEAAALNKRVAIDALATQMLLAEIDGLALAISPQGSRVDLSYEVVLREKSRYLELFGGEATRNTKALDRIPPPVVAALDVQLDGRSLKEALGNMLALDAGPAGPEVDPEVRELLSAVVDEIVANFGGAAGFALATLPSSPSTPDFGLMAWIAVEDAAKASSVAAQVFAKLKDKAGLTSRSVSGTTVYETAMGPKASIFIHEGFLWITTKPGAAESTIQGTTESFRASVRHPAVKATMEEGDKIAGFVDLKSIVTAANAWMSMARGSFSADPVAESLDVLTLRGKTEGQAVVVDAALFTSLDSALPALLGRIMQTTNTDAAMDDGRLERANQCVTLVRHILSVTERLLDDAGKSKDKLWELERGVLEQCNTGGLPPARMQCYLGAIDAASLQACDSVAATPANAVGAMKAGSPEVAPQATPPAPLPGLM